MKLTIGWSQVGVIALLITTAVFFQNCAQEKSTGGDAALDSQSVADAVDMQWIDQGTISPDYPNQVRLRKILYELHVDQESVLTATTFSNVKWDHEGEAITYFAAINKIKVNDERCALHRDYVDAATDPSIRLAASVSCVKVLSPGIHILEFMASGWTNREDMAPTFNDGHIGYSLIAR